MVDPITASYVQEDADWTITVNGHGEERTARAPGIIAARDRADQLVDELVSDSDDRTVVHLLNGSAIDFTKAYMEARLSRGTASTEAAEGAVDDDGSEEEAEPKPEAVAETAEAEEPAAAESEPAPTADEAGEAIDVAETEEDAGAPAQVPS